MSAARHILSIRQARRQGLADMTTAIDTDRPPASARSVHRRVGSSDLSVFPLAISGNVFGWTSDVLTTDAILDSYAAAGGNFIDTADSYAAGRSEIMVGNWMRDRGNRGEMVVATKVGKSADNPGLSARALTRSVHATCTSTTSPCRSRRRSSRSTS
jgi:hypothetical protein